MTRTTSWALWPRRASLTCLLAAFSLGCASTAYQYRITSTSSKPRATGQSESVPVLPELTPPESYEVVGKVWVYKLATTVFGYPTEADLFSKLSLLGASLGADEVIGAYSSTLGEQHRKWDANMWASGLAVRHRDAASETFRSELVIAIVPISVSADSTTSGEEWAERLNSLIQEGVQRSVEEKGYYGLISSGAIGKASGNMRSPGLNAITEQLADGILQVELHDATGMNAGIVAYDQVTLSASIYSRSREAVIWTGEGRAADLGLGLLEALLDNRMESRCYEAAHELLSSLEPICSEFDPEAN